MPRTLNDIIPPSRRRQMGVDITPPGDTLPPQTVRTNPTPKARGGFPYGTAIVALLVIAGAVGALFYFSGARVEVTPKTYDASISSSFTATPGVGDLPFKLVSVEKVGSQAVKADGVTQANDSAQGTITIMNAQTVPQTLIANTRFESPAGLIFKIHAPVTVPAGSPASPGTVSATIYADKGGVEYNLTPTTFTVPGLKGGKSYTLVTGKSTNAFTGGFSGQRPSVGEATHQTQVAAIEATLGKDLTAALAAQAPDGYVFVPGGTVTSYSPQSDTSAAADSVTISVKGTATGYAFPKEALAKAIAYKTVSMYAAEPVSLINTDGLTLSSNASSTPSGNQSLTFSLSGNTTLVWKIDVSKIAGAVAGKKRDSAQSILTGFPEIDKALLVLRPFFATTYPDDPAKITVVVKDPSTGKSAK